MRDAVQEIKEAAKGVDNARAGIFQIGLGGELDALILIITEPHAISAEGGIMSIRSKDERALFVGSLDKFYYVALQ